MFTAKGAHVPLDHCVAYKKTHLQLTTNYIKMVMLPILNKKIFKKEKEGAILKRKVNKCSHECRNL